MLNAFLGEDIGSVQAVKIRRTRSGEPESVQSVLALSGIGLDGDMHADPLSLRQVLLAGAGAYSQNDLPLNALRENLLLDIDTSLLKSGTVLRIGTEVILWLTFQCEACGHLNIQKPGLSKVIGAHRGMLARVVRGGAIRVEDRVQRLDFVLPIWSDDWRVRVIKVLDLVQSGTVIEYKQLARLAGVPSSYCRVFPQMTKVLGSIYAKKAVPANGKPSKKRWLGTEIFEVELIKLMQLTSVSQLDSIYNPKRYAPVQMPTQKYEEIKKQITRSLNESGSTGETLQVGDVRILLTKNRSLKNDNPSQAMYKPYPEVEGMVTNDYDSWLS
ncbi:MOSC domain-containing protein [Undibacterium sp. TJN19]|uniref:MOSC domain-containing protein n=1 Tax=Undibacterium sp. TJN19 TaxID=3413055 RepID=UPI003BF1E9DC